MCTYFPGMVNVCLCSRNVMLLYMAVQITYMMKSCVIVICRLAFINYQMDVDKVADILLPTPWLWDRYESTESVLHINSTEVWRLLSRPYETWMASTPRWAGFTEHIHTNMQSVGLSLRDQTCFLSCLQVFFINVVAYIHMLELVSTGSCFE